jgi:hypothetical protein
MAALDLQRAVLVMLLMLSLSKGARPRRQAAPICYLWP